MKLVPRENKIIDGLEPSTRTKVRRFVAWCERFLEGTRYRISIESFYKPWISGMRTVFQQRELYDQGRTKPGRKITNCDGVRKKSYHQSGKAIHLGLRWKRSNADSSGPEIPTGRWIRHQSRGESSEARQLFEAIAAEAKKRGFVWGGDWKNLRDYHHFELRD